MYYACDVSVKIWGLLDENKLLKSFPRLDLVCRYRQIDNFKY